jgi:uncharacterized phage protein (TIGR01671 family)
MEDRYLYRAKRVDTGEWVEGSLVTGVFFRLGQEIPYMFCPNLADYDCFEDFSEENGIFEVEPSTICQCTGLRDKNGKVIWENDIVKFEDCGEEGYEYKEGFDFENKARVEFTEGRWSLTDFLSDNSAVIDGMYDHEEFMDLWGECEVIGNMIDNPELLEV